MIKSFIIVSIIRCIVHATEGTNPIISPNATAGLESTNNEIVRNMNEDTSDLTADENEHELANIVLFPWFTVLIGVCAYYLISRRVPGFPYTAVMFMIGTIMGYFSLHTFGNAIVDSVRSWIGINGQVLMLVFLPGLLFLDSYNINVYLFKKSFSQIILFAFVMVLAGTALTALFAYYVFPYEWSFDLSMTFGSILAATDPVAVIVMMNSLGAPSRLMIHISGESLMNDGSSVVFYTIFSARYFYEMGIPGVGEEIGWIRGFILFFRLALGGVCIGLAFGVGLVTLLFNLNRRLSKEESVIQVSSTIMTAYLSYYVSEVICGCSGIIAVLFCGLTTKALGETLINDSQLIVDFWHIMEHLLNTILFTLAGTVWAGVISNTESFNGSMHSFKTIDWLYLLALYLYINLIRLVLIFLFFPITSKIGTSQDWQEALFMSYGGLRGAVAVSLGLLLNAETFQYCEYIETEDKASYKMFADQLFGMIGGIAFLTLVINGPTSAFVLKSLGLATPSTARNCVVKKYEQRMRQNILIEFITILSEQTFSNVDFGIVRKRVSSLKDVTPQELNLAVQAYKKKYPNDMPKLDNLIRHVSIKSMNENPSSTPDCAISDGIGPRTFEHAFNQTTSHSERRCSNYDMRTLLDNDAAFEERQIFLNLLRQAYHSQLKTGELDSRGFTPLSLLQSLDVADDLAKKGSSLQDWEVSQSFSKITRKLDNILHAYRVSRIFNRKGVDVDFFAQRSHVIQALSFIKAHKSAVEIFKAEFTSVDEQLLTLAEKAVIDESKEQVSRAEAVLNSFDSEDVNAIKSQYICQLLLYKSAYYFENLVMNGSMTEREARVFLERYDEELRQLRLSSEIKAEISYLKIDSERCGCYHC